MKIKKRRKNEKKGEIKNENKKSCDYEFSDH
ncbi:hypothetical protein ES708_19867 [subsurface metagenome]